jgi:hypothetical protein
MKQLICNNAEKCDLAGCSHKKAHDRIWRECSQVECFRSEIPVKCIPCNPVATSKGKKKER